MILIHDGGWTEVAFAPLPETLDTPPVAAARPAPGAGPGNGSFNSAIAALLAGIAVPALASAERG